MALGKKAKIWITLLSTPLILLLLIAIGLKLYLTSDRLKALVIPKIEEATGRSVSVEDISLSLFPSIAVSMDRLSISNPAGKKFTRERFVSFDNLRLKVSLLPLLKNNLEINYVIIDHPVINMEKLRDGSNNYSMTGGNAPGGEAEAGKGGGGALLLSNLRITGGEIEFINEKSDFRLLLKGLDQSSEVSSKDGTNAYIFSGTTAIREMSYGTLATWLLVDQPLTGTMKMSYGAQGDVLSFDEVKAKLKELPLVLTGSVSGLRKEVMIFDMTVSTPGAEMNQLLSLVPPDLLKAAKGLSSSGEIKFSAIVKGAMSETQTPGALATFSVRNGVIKYSALPKAITGIGIAGSFNRPEVVDGEKPVGKFELKEITASLGNNRLGGRLGLTDFDDPLVSAAFEGSVDLGGIKEFYPLEEGTELSGILGGDISVDGRAKNPQSVKAKGKIEFKNVSVKTAASPKALRNLTGTVSFNNQVIESKQLAMNVGESDMSLGFVLKNYLAVISKEAEKSGGKPTASLTLTSRQLRTADLISGDDPGAVPDKKSEQAPAGGVFLPGLDIDANVSVGRLVTEKFEFTNARGSVNVSEGIVKLKNFSVNAFEGTVITKGSLDLREMKKRPFDLDLEIAGVEASTALSKFSSFGRNIFGKFNMSTKLKGDLNDTLGIDTKTLGGDGRVQIFDGKLLGFPLTTKLAEATGLDELREVSFSDWANAFSISDGKISIKDLKVRAGSADFLVEGTHGLEGTMDYILNVKLPPSASDRLKLSGVASQLVQFFKDKENRISLNFNVRGTTSSPALSLNTKAQEEMAKQSLEKEKQKLLDEGKKKVGDELKKKAEEGLKKLFKKP